MALQAWLPKLAFVVVFAIFYPPISFLWFGLIVVVGLRLGGLLVVHIVSGLTIAGSDRDSSSYRWAVATMEKVQHRTEHQAFAMFCLVITGFGIPYMLPLVILYCLFTLPCLPLLALFYLVSLGQRGFPATSKRWRTMATRTCHSLVVSVKSLHRGFKEWTHSISFSLLSSRVWSLTNTSAMDRLVLFLRRAKARFQPALAVEDVARVISTAVLYYAAADSSLWVFPALCKVMLASPISVVQRLAEYYAAAKCEVKELDRQEWRDAHQSNSLVYASLPLAGGSATVNTTRLLMIRCGIHQEPLSCMLRVAQLSDHQYSPSYEAISYVWGSEPPSATMTVNGLCFRVSPSLRRMLLRLRSATRSRAVWVDAICINQGDLGERASQVRLMAQIFSLAKQVVVCFGERSPMGLDQAVNSCRAPPDDAGSIHYGAVRVAEALLSNPWWTRTWVIQEVVLARHIVVYCGAVEASWDELCRLLRRASRHPLFRSDRRALHLEDFLAVDRHHRQRKKLMRPLTRKPDEDGEPARLTSSFSRGRNLLALVFDFRTREATDPRDKIFALQGLSEEVELCAPNYVRPASELTVEFARSHIRHSRSLSVLALVECVRHLRASNPKRRRRREIKAEIPSWCPAFTDQDAVSKGLGFRPLWTGLPDDDVFGPCSAAGNLAIPEAFDPEVEDSEQALAIRVLQHVRLAVASVGPAYNASVDSLRRELLEVMYGRSGNMRSSLMGLLDKESVFDTWRDLVEGLRDLSDISGNDSTSSRSNGDAQVRDDLLDTLTAGGLVRQPGEPFEKPDGSLRNMACTRRKLFTTGCGSFGLGPENVMEGDEIYIALGCQTPIVLRPRAGKKTVEDQDEAVQYSYIGQAYIRQLMVYRGDLAEDLRTGKVRTEGKMVI
ncbi:Heterokaryon incompatibility protein 6, OR allele [Colletotrichum trifolii]|uniref:Heterokaryon incompatibility protein 6, OR allele n=1 Tax=Colletotrichum trifolii TaxID=5466 RepID=A0A4R8RSY7_COLTR|nr:Heterokaryon incompatibility protein 6, OR allele [Colletotrichum trifolii]